MNRQFGRMEAVMIVGRRNHVCEAGGKLISQKTNQEIQIKQIIKKVMPLVSG